MAGDEIFCANCGNVITGESESGAPEYRKPCPNCGSTSRKFSVKLSATLHAIATVSATVTTYPEVLLSVARSLIDASQHSVAVVVAHMACEVATERALGAAFAKRGLQDLEEAIGELLNGYNLANDKNTKLYNALTGQSIEQEAFWPEFKKSAKLRNHIMHAGQIATAAQAEATHRATSALVKHVLGL
jgi:hypothetical protein